MRRVFEHQRQTKNVVERGSGSVFDAVGLLDMEKELCTEGVADQVKWVVLHRRMLASW
jgi:hypothetical protein